MKKFIRITIAIILVTLIFIFLTPLTAATTPNTFNFKNNGEDITEYNIVNEDFNSTKEFTGNLIFNEQKEALTSIIFKNSTDLEDVQFEILELTNDIEDEELLNNLKLIISIDGSPIYDGSLNELPDPITNWIPAQDIDINFKFYLPEEFNYQETEINITLKANIKMVGAPENEPPVEEPPVPEEPETQDPQDPIPPEQDPVQENEKIETGDESGFDYRYLILIAAGIPLIFLALKKKDK